MDMQSVILSEKVIVSLGIQKNLYAFFKRMFDIIVGLIGVLFIIPLAFIIKVLSVANKDYHSIFFKQERIGKDGNLFTMYKFRTMVPNADKMLVDLMKNDPKFREEYSVNKKVKNDPRITKIGKILRKASLDEVPQFINVLLGDMSLVGNRPYLPREKQDMGAYYKHIITSKPGITGLWQTSGRSNTTFQERLMIEKRYNLIYGMRLDLKIIFKTILLVLNKDGAE